MLIGLLSQCGEDGIVWGRTNYFTLHNNSAFIIKALSAIILEKKTRKPTVTTSI